MLRSLTAALLVLLGAASSAVAGTLQLLMVEQHGCIYCLTWDREVGDAYDVTPEGRAAPLIRVQLRDPLPAGVVLDRPAVFTPTFVLLDDGREIGRIEGYPGEDFFYARLGQMLAAAGVSPPS